MSERTEIPALDPVAFVAALILAPLLFTALTFWVVLIPVGALIVGGLPYLILGTPVLLAMLFYGPCDVDRMTRAAIVTIAVPFAPMVVASLIYGREGVLPVFGMGLACMIFAAGWAATFASLYNRFYRNPVI
jgi:hypothetical protein